MGALDARRVGEGAVVRHYPLEDWSWSFEDLRLLSQDGFDNFNSVQHGRRKYIYARTLSQHVKCDIFLAMWAACIACDVSFGAAGAFYFLAAYNHSCEG
jgi:hypothetical protein